MPSNIRHTLRKINQKKLNYDKYIQFFITQRKKLNFTVEEMIIVLVKDEKL